MGWFGEKVCDGVDIWASGDLSQTASWQVSRSIDWWIDRSIDCLIDWLFDRLIDWLFDWLIVWLVDWLIDWLIDWSSCSLIDWLVDWLIFCCGYDVQCFTFVLLTIFVGSSVFYATRFTYSDSRIATLRLPLARLGTIREVRTFTPIMTSNSATGFFFEIRGNSEFFRNSLCNAQ